MNFKTNYTKNSIIKTGILVSVVLASYFGVSPAVFAVGTPFAQWNFDSGTIQGNTVIDASGNGRNGTMQNGVIITNGCAQFDGVDDRIIVPNMENSLFSYAAWVRKENSGKGYPALLVSANSSGFGIGFMKNIGSTTFNDGYPNNMAPTGPAAIHLSLTDGGALRRTTGILQTNQWYHVAVTHNGSEVRFYVNGQLDSSQNYSQVFGGGGNYQIGFRLSPAGYESAFKGLMDDIRVYNSILTAQEVSSLSQIQPTCAVQTTYQCSDNIDNDGDGATDYPNDFSCSSATDNDEANPKAQCQDGVDNDGDGLIDYPSDPGCANKQDNIEQNSAAVCSSNSNCGTDAYTGSSFCMGNSVYKNYLTYTCNNPGANNSYCSNSTSPQLQQICSANQICSFGICSNTITNQCVNHSYQQCSGNAVYWYDSCGNRQDVVQICSSNQTCSGNICANTNYCVDRSYKQCVGSNAIYWFNSCGVQQDLYQVCSAGQICSAGTCVISQQQTGFTVTKTARNLSAGILNWSNSVAASPSDIVQFTVAINNYSNQTASNVVIRDNLPANLSYNNNLTIDGVANAGNITQGITIGSMSPGQVKTIVYQTQVASAQNFSFGTTTLTNSIVATIVNFSPVTATASVVVTKSGVLGATTISTGLTNNLWLDSFIIPLLIALAGIWLYKSGLVGMPRWLVSRRKKIQGRVAQRRLENKIHQIRQNENNE